MIVVCTTCQSRFKVADEKIGPRGAKVRCSKCQTVFVVHRELGVVGVEGAPPPAAAPAPPPAPRPTGGLDLDLESEPMGGTRPSGFIADPFSRPAAPPPAHDPFSIPGPGFPGHAAAARPAPDDPFAAGDPFAGSAPAPAPPAPSVGDADPFAGGGAGLRGVDSFVATVANPPPGIPNSAVTDLSDLLGGGGAPPPPQSAPGVLESGFDFAEEPGASGLEVQGAPGRSPAPDLALADRTPSNGLPTAGSPPVPMPGFGDFAGVDPFEEHGGAPPAGAPAGMQDFGGLDEEFGSAPELAEPSPPPQPPPPSLQPPAPAHVPAAAPAAPAAARPEEAAAEGLRHRSSRVRAVAINTLSLVALLAVVVVLLALWRGLRPGTGGLIHPGVLFGGGGGAERRDFEATQVRSGRYERADAPPLVFVTGTAVSRAAAPVPGLEVRVELLGKAGVVASGAARAGAVPGPEALHAARDAAALAAAYEELAASVPAAVKPGEGVPFLVAILDPPADVAGLGLRVTVEPSPAPAPEAAAPPPGEAAPGDAPAGAAPPPAAAPQPGGTRRP